MSEQTVTRQHLAGLEMARAVLPAKSRINHLVALDALIAQASAAPEQEWSSKPTACGAYWIRGNGLEAPALIEVKTEEGELWCNLHMRNTEPVFEYGYTVAQLSDEFEFSGPLYTHADPAEVERLRAENRRLDLMVSQADFNYDSDRDDFHRKLAQYQALLRRVIDTGELSREQHSELEAEICESLRPAAQPADGVNSDE